MQRDLAGNEGRQDQDVPKPALYHSYVHGGISSLICTISTFPVYKTVFRQQLHSIMIHQAVSQLYQEGLIKLYRGVLPPLLMKTIQGTVLFGFQNTLLQRLSACPEPLLPRSALPAVAGLGTGMAEAVILTPFERVQCILQNNSNDRSLPTITKIIIRLRSESLGSGWFRAFLPTLARNALGSSLYFGLNDPLASVLSEQQFPPMVSSFISGAGRGLVISLPLYPLSVLVANMQAQVGVENLGLRASWRQLWHKRQRSLVLLYRGGFLVILRSCISWGITTLIYDHLTRLTG